MTAPSSPEEALEDLLAQLRQDYLAVRLLPDGSIACLGDLLYTRAIILGADRYTWSHRFCFADRLLANKRFLELQSEDDVPAGYTARR
jgi:hypothetical protein